MIWFVAVVLALVCFVVGFFMGAHKATLFTWQRARTMTPDAFAQFRHVMTADTINDRRP